MNPLPLYATRPPHGPAAERLAARIAAGLPPALVTLWRAEAYGLLLVTPEEPPHFTPGERLWRDQWARGALFLPPHTPADAAWRVVGAWLDCFAGGGGRALEARLSQGQGATPALGEAALALQGTLRLGYAAPFLGTDDPTLLLPRALAAYQLTPQPLSVADPALARWLRGTLLNEGFWRRVAREWGASEGVI